MTASRSLGRLTAGGAAVLLALLGAAAIAAVPEPVYVLGAAAGVLVAGVILVRPEAGALLIIVLTAVLPRTVLFDRGLPVAGGSLKITDILLLLTIGGWVVHLVLHHGRLALPSKLTTALLAALLAAALVSLGTANALGAPRKLSLLELRPLLSYLLVFPIVSGVRSRKQLDRGIVVVLVAAAASSLIAITEYVRGAGGAATFADGAIRVQNAVYLYPLLAVIWAVVALAYFRSSRARLAVTLLAAVGLGGIFFTFARGAWIAILTVVPLIVVLLPARGRVRLLIWSLPLATVAAAGVLTLNALSIRGVQNPLSAGLSRLESLGGYRGDVSSEYRIAEWSRALAVIRQHPLTGIGLGNSITFESPMYSAQYNTYGFTFSTYYIHNSYIWFALKLGLFGAAMAIGLVVEVCVRAYRGLRRAIDPSVHMILLASLASVVALAILATSGPHLNIDNATPAVAALIAAIEVTCSRLDADSRRASGVA